MSADTYFIQQNTNGKYVLQAGIATKTGNFPDPELATEHIFDTKDAAVEYATAAAAETGYSVSIVTPALYDFYQAHPVKAVQLTETNGEAIAEWIGGKMGHVSEVAEITPGVEVTTISATVTLPNVRPGANRPIVAHVDDWVIQEASGKFRVFKERVFPRIFDKI